MPHLRHVAAPLTLLTTLLVSGCSSDAPPTQDVATAEPQVQRLEVIASFYPLEHLVTRIAGDHAEVSSLTAPGVDPHDVELTPRVVGSLASADLVLYASGMQPAVDAAVQQQVESTRLLDVVPAAELLEVEEEHAAHENHEHDGEDEHEDAHEHEGHDHGPQDPHFWLDPTRYSSVAVEIAEHLAAIDPDHAEEYRRNVKVVQEDLAAIDAEYRTGLQDCRSRELVTTHEAFGYLAHRYDLHQSGITGISPESEPSPARLAEISSQVRDRGITTIFAEPILSDGIARTVAQETGAEVLVLDPVEGVTDASPGTDYASIMRANLEALQNGLGCS